MRWVPHRNAAEQLSGDRDKLIPRLVQLDVLKERKGPKGREVALAEGVDRDLLLELHYAEVGPCLTPVAVERMGDVVRTLTWRRGDAAAPPSGFIRDAIAQMQAQGIEIAAEQLVAVTGMNIAHAQRVALDVVAEQGGTVEETRRHFRFTPGAHQAAVIARLPEELREAPGTHLCPNHGNPGDAPPEKTFARLAELKDDRLFTATALAVLRMAATGVDAREMDRTLAEMSRSDGVADARGMDDPFVVRDRLEAVLGTGWAISTDADGARVLAVDRYFRVHDLLAEYIRNTVPAHLRPAFARHQLVLPAGAVKFRGAVKKGVARYRTACAASRQTRIEKILDHPLEFLLVGRLRLEEHIELRDAVRKKIDEHIASGKPLTEPIAFQHTYVTRLTNERFRRCEQTVHFLLWTWDLVHEKSNAIRRSRNLKPYSLSPGLRQLTGRDTYVVSFAGVTPARPGGPTQKPIVAEVADAGLLTAMSSADGDQLLRRTAACKRYEFPTKRPNNPSGVGHFERSWSIAARNANKWLTQIDPDGSTSRVLLLPLEEFTHGLMYAHASVFIAADAGSRDGEVLQAPADPRKYETRPHKPTGDVFKAYKCIGKGGPPEIEALMSPDTFRHLTDLILESARRWHRGRPGPSVAPPSHLKKWKVQPGRFAFAVRDRIIQLSELGTLHRLLYLGWHGLRGHDVRHVFTALCRRDGIPREVRQQLLHHADPSTTDLYGPATPGEVSRMQMKLNVHLSERVAKLRDAAGGGVSEEMRRADIELRRAEMNMRFYQEHSMGTEAEGMKQDVERWAGELARATAVHTGGDQVIRAEAV